MQVRADQTDPSSLETLAKQAAHLLSARKFAALAESFGYAVALGRDHAFAIEADLQASLEALGASHLAGHEPLQAEVKYFEGDSVPFAVVECTLSANNGGVLLAELVVTKQGETAHVTLEQISAAA
jgi:hypothetical protein